VTSSVGRNPAAIDELAALAEEFALPVVQSEARDFNLPTNHSMHVGFEPASLLAKADVVIVLESAVPWIPGAHSPRPDAKVITSRAIRWRAGFRSARSRRTCWSPASAGRARHAASMPGRSRQTAKNGSAAARRKTIAAAREEIAARRKKLIDTVKDQTPVHPAWLAHCLNQVKSENAIVSASSAYRSPVST